MHNTVCHKKYKFVIWTVKKAKEPKCVMKHAFVLKHVTNRRTLNSFKWYLGSDLCLQAYAQRIGSELT